MRGANAKCARDRLAEEVRRAEQKGVQYWPLRLSAEPQVFVGCCGLRPREDERRVYELGFHLCSSHWNCGFATEAARSVLEHAFKTLSAEAVMAGHFTENAASKQVLLKLGFTYT